MSGAPSYLRVVVTEKCPMNCRYCHAEGLKLARPPSEPERSSTNSKEDGAIELRTLGMNRPGMKGLHYQKLPLPIWKDMLRVALDAGIQKLKFLGGEPLLFPNLSSLVQFVKHHAPGTDVSLVTSGAVPATSLDKAFEAGLDRANLTIHGWTRDAFARNARTQYLYDLRQALLQHLLDYGRPLKLNYVYTGAEVESDLLELLTWASSRPLTVSVLDDLNEPEITTEVVRSALIRLCGPPLQITREEDPHSLPTQRIHWRSGLEVELKDHPLGELAPWVTCRDCSRKSMCLEGIFALRLDPDGLVRFCADRPDLGFSLSEAVSRGREEGLRLLLRQLEELLPTPAGSEPPRSAA